MPGKRLRDPSLIRTTFEEVVNNNGEILTDWEVNNPANQLVWARPIPLKLIGNAWFQGSYDSATWSNIVEDDHDYIRVSTDGGDTWRVIDLTGGGDEHPPVTIGTPDGGLAIVSATQVLTLSPSSDTNPGSMSASHYTKLTDLKFDYLDNVGTGEGIFKDYTDSGDDRTHHLKTLVAGTGVTLTPGTDTITIDATGAGGGETNTGSNVGTDGVGVFDAKVGVDLQFRNVASLHTGLSITFDAVDNDIDFDLIEANIDHNSLENYDPNEHIDHTTVSILTQEGITGGGDLTATRTLTLAFDELTQETDPPLQTDIFAFYRNDSGEDEHFSISYEKLIEGVTEVHNTYYVPLTTGVYTLTGLTGGGVLDIDRYVGLAFQNLPTIPYDSGDFIAVYDTTSATHAKVTLADVIGELAVSISAGDGMDFTTITSTGNIDMGTPTTLSKAIIANAAIGTTHQHIVDLSTWDVQDLGNVDTPIDTYFVYYDLATNMFKFADPGIGATTPGLPLNSIQYNDSNTFGGDAGLLYDPTVDTIYFDDVNTSTGANFIFGDDLATSPSIHKNQSGLTVSLVLENDNADQHIIQLLGSRLVMGDPTLDGTVFMHIKDTNAITYDEVLRIDNLSDETMLDLSNSGDFYLPKLSSASTDNVLYFDDTTGLVTWGAKPTTSGGVQTLVADPYSGMMVNGGSTSSASTIELDQNDYKLTESTPVVTDYIGFYDVSTGTQSRTLMSFLPGWNIEVDGIFQEEIGPGASLNFDAGSGIVLSYNDALNTLTIDSSSSGACSQLVDGLGTITDGNTAYLDLDVYSGATMTIDTGASVTLEFDNIEEGDTGHVEINHNGDATLTLSAPGATIKIALNSYSAANQVALSTIATIDVLAFWFAKGYFHVAMIYDMQ